jgi:hypothetical protein
MLQRKMEVGLAATEKLTTIFYWLFISEKASKHTMISTQRYPYRTRHKKAIIGMMAFYVYILFGWLW